VTLRALRTTALAALLSAFAAHPNAVWACAACYGQSDSPMARGMNWGIFSLLGVVVLVLGGVAGFFIYLARKAADVSAASDPMLSTDKI
jgi:heme/copper-type cytochrome/quinol oxidase subunit 2